MEILQIIFAALFGLAFGSFLNVCISRLPQHRSIVRPGSHCPLCRTPLQARDNIPLLSFVMLRGRCRSCGQPISWRYPIVEFATAVAAVLCILAFGLTPGSIAITFFCTIMIALAVTDLETFLLPDAITLPAIGLGLVDRTMDGWLRAAHAGSANAWQAGLLWGLRAAISAVATALVLLSLRWLYWLLRRRQGMGLGDVKLAAAIAAWLGARQAALAFFLASICGAVVGLMLLAVVKRRRGAGEPAMTAGEAALPFGFFLCLGAIYCVFYGPQTLTWYLRFFP